MLVRLLRNRKKENLQFIFIKGLRTLMRTKSMLGMIACRQLIEIWISSIRRLYSTWRPNVQIWQEPDRTRARNLKREIVSLFDPCFNATGRRPYWTSRIEVSYCTCGSFSSICAHYRYCVIYLAITYMRAWFESTLERQLNITNLLEGLSYEKIRRCNNSAPYVTVK